MTTKHYPKTPWIVKSFPNGAPFIQDADGWTVCQVHGSIRYGQTCYDVPNLIHATIICECVNKLYPPLKK
jgi:hypothetical protein